MKLVLSALFFFVMAAGAVAQTDMNQNRYEQLNSVELFLQYSMLDGLPLVGSKILEKLDSSFLCQKSSAVVRNPQPAYFCLVAVDEMDSKQLFESIDDIAMGLTFSDLSGQKMKGIRVLEKSDDRHLCREYTPDATGVATYRCFVK